ncbi:Bifunctional purine biosynthesis protein PurH [Dissostichus eleginoides]|uniref:Bifunctional purine biosynthesis protein PurH n=1 Tax=Dissostichus eleginoides TaxID=100907 RepID=A0AAD9BXE3_DISEL|nr:Bifunctional purine biosynthesis protein PurH [Dissostichus eleginoides]
MKAAELEHYKRRWNLRLNGLKEEKEENTRQIIADIIGKVVPHWKEKMDFILDSVHRLGKYDTNRPRQIIMQFTGRHFMDELWRTTKQHHLCDHLKISFAEDLTKEDREARRAVWPKVEQARKAGLKTVFRGPHAFINGQRVTP